ncbi:hypothetical protein BZ13_851 [Francisella philomiragia subsp. philomiragia ATCC 25015]|uniref:hypothetical protein n=1 Tax=Francisella philomiragia TaxID=28110 RepID=UPI0001AF7890|nr:hypothetical protein [Francisella philomiragia]AJI74496.1 hypothetical protein BZ13_851 [Francisella philomiragia subsp. philomiragia ATCC 25015]EET20927.1 predicted protein [Francisella philomiragia subsp. philomiragia ATCC 25015]MBK2238183.1 hypothetical protein [Francisella philomiragia]
MIDNKCKVIISNKAITAFFFDVDFDSYAFYLKKKIVIEKTDYQKCNTYIFSHELSPGNYTVSFFAKKGKKVSKTSIEFDISQSQIDNSFTDKNVLFTSQTPVQNIEKTPTNPVESNKLLLKMMAEKDNDLIRFTSELGLLETKLQAKTKDLELRDKELVKLKSALKESEKSLLAKSNQVVELIDRNELVDAHLKNVQTSLEKKEQILSKIKAEFDILKGQLKSTL